MLMPGSYGRNKKEYQEYEEKTTRAIPVVLTFAMSNMNPILTGTLALLSRKPGREVKKKQQQCQSEFKMNFII